MNALVILCGASITAIAAWGMASPPGLRALFERMRSPRALWAVAAARLAMGVIFLLAASGSRWPLFLQVLGWFVLAAGVITLLTGSERGGRMIDWWSARPAGVLRAWCAFALAFGVVIIVAGT